MNRKNEHVTVTSPATSELRIGSVFHRPWREYSVQPPMCPSKKSKIKSLMLPNAVIPTIRIRNKNVWTKIANSEPALCHCQAQQKPQARGFSLWNRVRSFANPPFSRPRWRMRATGHGGGKLCHAALRNKERPAVVSYPLLVLRPSFRNKASLLNITARLTPSLARNSSLTSYRVSALRTASWQQGGDQQAGKPFECPV